MNALMLSFALNTMFVILTKCRKETSDVTRHDLTPPTPSGDPLGIDTSCQGLFLGIRIVGKVLPARFQVLPGIGDPWIGHV